MTKQTFSRRHLFGSAAVIGIGGPLLTACGGESKDEETPSPDPGMQLTSTADVPVGGGVILPEEKVVVTQPTRGKFQGFSAICTHQSCLVSEVTETIDCACHGSKFSLADGSVSQGPATEALPAVPVTVKGNKILTT
ncbi:MAG: Rieske (2Fe-2S) protein [Nocardioides sp.]|nr:Rieske (2Fe-2S) protein [Nocardioides sp.]